MTKDITIDDLKRYRALVETGSVLDKNTVLNIISYAGEAAETIQRKQNAIDTLDDIITQQCQAALDATGLHHLIDEDGDGDWSAVWEGLQDLKATSKPEQNFEVVATVEELDAFPDGAVVLDVYGASVTKLDRSTWVRVTPAIHGGRMFHAPFLPARVLYRPEVDE